MKFNRKTAISLLCLLITLSMLAAVGVQTVFADGVVVNVNSSSGTGRSAQSIGGDYGIRLGINGAFTEVSVSMPTWSTTDSAATLSLYAWDTNYDLTIMSDPLVTQRFDPLRDNAYNKLTFDALPAGEYFLRIHDVRGQVGVWVQNYSDNGSFVYTNGSEGRRDWDMKVTFAEQTEQPFFQLEPQTIVEPDEPVIIPEDSLSHQTTVMPDTWVFTDGLGRVSLTYADVGAPREDKTLAMFYWTWHTKETASKGAVNTTELLKEYPDAKNDYNHAAWQGKGHYCFWNEPIYGFYTTEDPWVLRRQAELLANAGVDTVFTDNTNGGFTWRESYLVLYPTWEEALKSGGVDVPKVSFLLPFGAHDGAISQANVIYHDIYKPGLYKDLWFYWDDKPMLMGIRTAVPDGEIGKEIKSFFSWRAGQPEYLVAGTAAKQWGWLSTYPQALYSPTGAKGLKKGEVEQMSVGVAVNHNYVTHEITAMNGENVMGRSYTSDYPDRYEKEGPDASLWGYQFAEQFNYALEVDPEVIFVTGWNEWHAWRQPNPWGGANSQVNNALVDQFDNEHSRDLEPTKGELKDHYYYQFVNFARQYKGVNPIPEPSFAATIDLGAGQAQWKDIAPYYEAYANNTGDRKSSGYGNYKYTETSGRNDLIGAQVARDDEYVYFNVECAEDITPYTDSLWMTLYIDSDQSNQGWETFEYVINKSAASADTVVLEKFSGNGYESVKVADCAYTVDGRYMTVKVAKSDLGLSSNDFTINFSWTDNVHDEGDYSTFSGDIMDFYISGDVAPGARFKYSYVSTQQNAVPAPPTTEEETTEPVESTDAPATESEQETEPEAEGGCKSMTASAALIACICLGAIVIGKKKN
ncbi:MAG: hypothetical protein E7594_06895 [Ruminococcaceae bacterium]|nr:hypothetical protein [Oscillospiraceae bacterium]